MFLSNKLFIELMAHIFVVVAPFTCQVQLNLFGPSARHS